MYQISDIIYSRVANDVGSCLTVKIVLARHAAAQRCAKLATATSGYTYPRGGMITGSASRPQYPNCLEWRRALAAVPSDV